MATWTNIDDTFLEPGKPVRSVDGLALRDNPVAIAAGAAGAPKIQNAAMGNNTVDDRLLAGSATTAGRDWVLARTALAQAGAVGTYATLRYEGGFGLISTGQTVAGSALIYVSFDGSITSGSSLSGTWRNMGAFVDPNASAARRVSLWLRIS